MSKAFNKYKTVCYYQIILRDYVFIIMIQTVLMPYKQQTAERIMAKQRFFSGPKMCE